MCVCVCVLIDDCIWYMFMQSTVQAKPFWKAYILEMLVISVMVLYLVSYFVGRARNGSLAQQW